MDKALGLLPLLLAWEACAVVSADTNCEASEGQGLILCSQTDCVLNPTVCHRTCKADAEININSAELEACCCLYLLAFFFFFLFALLSVHGLRTCCSSCGLVRLEMAIPGHHQDRLGSSLTLFCHTASALKLVNKPCSEKYFC